MIIVVDNARKQKVKMYFTYLIKYLRKNNIEFTVINGDISGIEKIKKCHDADGIILSGSPMMLNNSNPNDYAVNTYCLSKLSHIPTLGICFGCQFIVSYYGGVLTSLGELHCKQYTVQSLSKRSLSFVAQFCCTYMPWLLPKSLKKTYSVYINDIEYACGIKHIRKPVYGFMFHPEKLASTQKFLDNFIEKCKCKKYA